MFLVLQSSFEANGAELSWNVDANRERSFNFWKIVKVLLGVTVLLVLCWNVIAVFKDCKIVSSFQVKCEDEEIFKAGKVLSNEVGY